MQLRPNAPLYFIRHGETDWNIARRLQGQSDIPLNGHGKEQAKENGIILASVLKQHGGLEQITNFVSSPLSRAHHTAQLLAIELGLSGVEIQTNSALQEISFGRWEGLTSEEVKQQYYHERKKRRKNRWEIAPPEGESFAERVAGVEQLLNALPAHSVVVSHSGIMRIILYLLKNLHPEDAVKLKIPHIGVQFWDGNSLNFIEN